MKIVLFTLNGSWAHSSLSLRCLREPLEREGHEVVVMEYSLRDRSAHVLQALYGERADVYGFSCYIWNLAPMLSLGESLKALLPHTHLVLGGPEVSYATERFDVADWIDAIVCGEGEEVFSSLCRSIEQGLGHERILQGGLPNVMSNEGILYRDGEKTGTVLYYESSRGCPFSCAYCLSSATKGVRFKSVEQVITDLEAFEALQIDRRVIKFVDRTFNADVVRANRIWRALLSDRFTGSYQFEVCATLLNEESFEILSAFPKGKIRLEFGLQSTNPRTLAAVSRHLEPEGVLRAVRRLRKMGNIHLHLDLIAGLPFEDYQSFARSFDKAYGTADLLQLGFLKLLFGTELRAKQREYGYICLPEPPYTVLQSHWITYEEMGRLFGIAELLERYCESERFVHTLWYLDPLMQSPFAFWEGFLFYLRGADPRPLQKISQPDAYRYLLQYATERVKGLDPARLREMLCADFTMGEHKNPPAFLI